MPKLKKGWTVIAAALLSMATAQVAVAAPSDDSIRFRVRSGDNLFALARSYFVRQADYLQVQRLNKIADPYHIPVGTMISIPRNLLKFKPGTARLLSVRGNVTAGNGAALRNGQVLAEGATVVTAANSFATVSLDDGSRVSLPSNSVVQISRLRTYLLGGSLDYDFDVKQGGAHSRVVKKQSEDDRYRVRTKRAVSAVRGTEFQSRFDEAAGTDFAEVSEGLVDVEAGAKANPVEAGKGLIVSPNGAAIVAELAPKPSVANAGKVQANPIVEFAVEDATPERNYRFALAADAGFVDQIAEIEAPGGKAGFSDLPNGNYFLRAREVANSGLQGLPATYGFKRRLNGIKASAEALGEGYVFKWQGEGEGVRRFHFQLVRDGSNTLPLIDEAGLTAQQIVISDLPPGKYGWRVASVQYLDGEVGTNWTPIEKLTIAAQ